jgi:hypothetical protein
MPREKLTAGTALVWLDRAAVLLLVAVAWYLCRRGFIPSDEGYLLVQAEAVSRGAVPYRDLDSFVAPGAWLLLGALFRIFEPSVLLSRLPIGICFIGCGLLLRTIARRLGGPGAGLLAVLAYGILTVWSFPAWTFSFYSPYAVTFALAALERVLLWQDRRRGSLLVTAGLLIGAATIFKQNYGALAGFGLALAVTLTLFLEHPPGRALGEVAASGARMLAGFLVALVPVLAWFALRDGLPALWTALVLDPFTKFVGHHSVPFPPLEALWRDPPLSGVDRLIYGSYVYTTSPMPLSALWVRPLIERLHVALYWIALLALALGFLLAARRRDGRDFDLPLLTTATMAATLFLGVFPRADYNHLLNVYQPLTVLIAVATVRVAEDLGPATMLRRALATAGILVVVLYGGLAAFWGLRLMTDNRTPLVPPRGGVQTDPWTASMWQYEVDEIHARLAPGEPVLTLPGLSMLNFLAERPAPTRYNNYYAVHIAHDQGAEVVREAEAADVGLVVAESNDFFTDVEGLRSYAPILVGWLQASFEPELLVSDGRHMFYRRRGTPETRPRLDVLQSCDTELTVGKRNIREKLLGRELVHRYRERSALLMDDVLDIDAELVTTCAFAEPLTAGELRFAFDYTRPEDVLEGSSVGYSIFGLASGEEEFLLVQEDRPIETGEGWGRPAPSETEVDLAIAPRPIAGLRFASRFRGRVRSNYLAFDRFAARWIDPVILAASPTTAR